MNGAYKDVQLAKRIGPNHYPMILQGYFIIG